MHPFKGAYLGHYSKHKISLVQSCMGSNLKIAYAIHDSMHAVDRIAPSTLRGL